MLGSYYVVITNEYHLAGIPPKIKIPAFVVCSSLPC